MRWYIYILIDPRNMAYRYVGWTRKPSRRVSDHIYYANKNKNSHRARWLLQLDTLGLKPILKIIEEGIGETTWAAREVYWIQRYKEYGCKLVNATTGGEGIVGYKFSKETIEKIAAKKRGKKWTPGQHLKSKLRPPLSETTRLKMRLAQLGKRKKRVKNPRVYQIKIAKPIKGVDRRNQIIGSLTVLTVVGRHRKELLWSCRCECGNELELKASTLANASITDCGCKSGRGRKLLRVGQTFGSLTVIADATSKVDGKLTGKSKSLCECICGLRTLVLNTALTGHRIKSCGCINSLPDRGALKGAVYKLWNHCINAGLPIQWSTYIEFRRSLGKKPSATALPSLHVEQLGLVAGNAYWKTPSQCRKRLIEANGRSLGIGEWAKLLNCDRGTLRNKLAKGHTIESLSKLHAVSLDVFP